MQSKTETSLFWNNFIKKKKFIHHNVDWKQFFYFCDVILIEIEIVYSVQSFDSLFNEHDLYTCTLLRM